MITAEPQTQQPDADRLRHRAICLAYKAHIKADAVDIRSAKAELHKAQKERSALTDRLQSTLARRRQEARARLIAYGLHRGIALERIEDGRASFDDLPPRLPALIRRVASQVEQEALEAMTPAAEPT